MDARGCYSCGKPVKKANHHAGYAPDGEWRTWLCLPCLRKGATAAKRRAKARQRDLVRRRVCVHCNAVVDNRTTRKAGPMVGDRWIHADCVAKSEASLQDIQRSNKAMMKRIAEVFSAY